MRRIVAGLLNIVVIVALGATAVAAVPASAAPAGVGWSVETTALRSIPSDAAMAVSCLSATTCVAAGGYGTMPGATNTLVGEHHKGTWSLQPTPNPPGAATSTLTAVSCRSVEECLAVGSSAEVVGGAPSPLIEASQGGRWSILAAPAPAGVRLTSLRGVSSTSIECVVVGLGAMGGAQVPVAAALQAGQWTVSVLPVPTGTEDGSVDSVSCASATDCVAVGAVAVADTPTIDPLAEAWDGTTWSAQSVPSPGGLYQATDLDGVSCASASDCVAVGYTEEDGSPDSAFPGAVIESWNGSAWSLTPTPPVAYQTSVLTAVSCAGEVGCIAVGTQSDSDQGPQPVFPHGLTETLAGSGWTVEPIVTSQRAAGSALSGVSCAAGACLAVGDEVTALGTTLPLTERWDGATWSRPSTPVLRGDGGGAFDGISCPDPSTCTAVGYGGSGALVERRDGGEWSVARVPEPAGTTSSVLFGVSCAASTSCVAVGQYHGGEAGGPSAGLAETWHGSRVSEERVGGKDSSLAGVSCASADDCIAVGTADDSPLAEQWNGTRWSRQPLPTIPGSAFASLYGVSCATTTFCTAVGSYFDSASHSSVALAEVWNGTTWTLGRLAEASGSELFSVSCTAPDFCLADGATTTTDLPVVEEWDGTTWAVPTGVTDQVGGYSAVACGSSTGCALVGYTIQDGAVHAVTDLWNGTTFTSPGAPPRVPGTGGPPTFNGVSCPTAASCTFAGQAGADPDSGNVPVVETHPLPAG